MMVEFDSKLKIEPILIFEIVSGSSFLRSVEVYDPNYDEWKTIAPMNVKRSRVALTANMGKLYAIGGYDGKFNQSFALLQSHW